MALEVARHRATPERYRDDCDGYREVQNHPDALLLGVVVPAFSGRVHDPNYGNNKRTGEETKQQNRKQVRQHRLAERAGSEHNWLHV